MRDLLLCAKHLFVAANGMKYNLVIQISLESDERIFDDRHIAQLISRIGNRRYFTQKACKFLLIEFSHALFHVLGKHEIQKRLQFFIVAGQDIALSSFYANSLDAHSFNLFALINVQEFVIASDHIVAD